MSIKLILGAESAPIGEFTQVHLQQVSGESGLDIVSNELTIDRLATTLRYTFVASRTISPTDYDMLITRNGLVMRSYATGTDLVSETPYGTPVTLWVDEVCKGRFYVNTIQKLGASVWKIDAVSIIGLFNSQEHAGNIYLGERFVDVVAGIWGGTVNGPLDGFYTIVGGPEVCYVETELAESPVYNYLPYSSKRKNLHQLLFATGASIVRNDAAEVTIVYLKNAEATDIADNRVFVESSIDSEAKVTGVTVVEHVWQYAYNAPESQLYSNTDAYAEAADNVQIRFTDPVNPDTLRTEGDLTISSCGPTYAVVSGKGSLYGVVYVHITREITKEIEDTQIPKNIKRVESANLISPLNSENVLNRLFDFYVSRYLVSASFITETERPGSVVEYNTSLQERKRSIIQSMSYTVSSFTKSVCKLVSGYTPKYFGNNYNRSYLFTTETEWTVPESIRNSSFPYVRVTLVGGGQGGQGGYGGMQGRGCYHENSEYVGHGSGKGGRGGQGGAAGNGGYVYSIAKLDVSNVAKLRFVPGSPGVGSAGGTGGYNGTDESYVITELGSVGGDSLLILLDDNDQVITQYTTGSGGILPYGVADITRNIVFGLSGIKGIGGADGGEGGVASPGADGTAGGDVLEWKGGEGSLAGYASHNSGQGMMEAMAGGAGGGGAAYGADGQDAISDGSASWKQYVWGGDAGNGASAAITPVAPVVPGQGGDGGHGGGGGGTGGAQNWTPITSGVKDGTPGQGGNGSAGANGCGGCMVLYTP